MYERINRKFANDAGDYRQRTAQATPTWIVAIFPQMEEIALYTTWARAVGYGTSATPVMPMSAVTTLFATPIPTLNCPTRRSPMAFAIASTDTITVSQFGPIITKATRADYALNGGADAQPTDTLANPKVGLPGIWEAVSQTSTKSKTVRIRDVTDGLSKTYLAAEKMVPADAYENGLFWGDNGSIYTCPLGDCVRFAEQPPAHDIVSYKNQNQACWSCHSFGSLIPARGMPCIATARSMRPRLISALLRTERWPAARRGIWSIQKRIDRNSIGGSATAASFFAGKSDVW